MVRGFLKLNCHTVPCSPSRTDTTHEAICCQIQVLRTFVSQLT